MRHIDYQLARQGESPRRFRITLAGSPPRCCEPAATSAPWTALTTAQCPDCPLDASQTPDCPMAGRLAPMVTLTADLVSFDEVDWQVIRNGRTLSGRGPAQAVLGSAIGLIAATSGCPLTAFLAPLAWFHQPLAEEDETIFRAVACACMEQQLHPQDGEVLARLSERYALLHRVNLAFAERLRIATGEDAAVNGLIRLDMFARAVPWSIEDALVELQPLFAPTEG